ncbi:hypothetical protein, partial [Nocardia wallacei]|uniref:hypothetical protein n=1 Tax=Nocardia wallacei TaxID=480035 RepID=UPI0024550EE8
MVFPFESCPVRRRRPARGAAGEQAQDFRCHPGLEFHVLGGAPDSVAFAASFAQVLVGQALL